jgi:cytochrome P450
MQAGFNADVVEKTSSSSTNKPILYQEGKVHNQQRKQTARFFTPKTVSSNYRQLVEMLSDRLINELKHKKRVDLSKLSLRIAMRVAGEVVGLTSSNVAGMTRRLDAFFQHSETQLNWKPLVKLLRLINYGNLFIFYFLDVKPAIRARKRQPQEDVISHLLGLNYNDAEILTECVTYAAAGMATTREFICVAAWHFLEYPELRARYLVAPEEERFEMLHEVLRLEPIVGNLYRRTTANIHLESQGIQFVIPEGALINIHVYATNTDAMVVGEEPLALCPGRALHRDRVPSMLMSFGDGHHRCPGSFLAIQETDIFLQRLLALDSLCIERAPTVCWNELVTGYELRNFIIALD